MIKENLYNAFTKIGAPEKNKLVNFLYANLGADAPNKLDIQQAIDYAVKDCPSFGGYILTAELDSEIVCAAVINETGMEGYYTRNIMVLFAIDPELMPDSVADKILKRAAEYARGDIILRLSSENPAFDIIEQFGLEATHVELRFTHVRLVASQKR